MKIKTNVGDIVDAVDFLERVRADGKYKLVIQAYPKDSVWTVKAYHIEGWKKSYTTTGSTFVEAVLLAKEKYI